jgi:hypothetical protein
MEDTGGDHCDDPSPVCSREYLEARIKRSKTVNSEILIRRERADVFMVAELKPGALKGRSGIVVYQPEFRG